MICYDKLFELMKAQGKNTTHIRAEKIISQDTLGKMRKGTGIIDEGRDPNNILPDGKQAKKMRITAVDTKSIESLCTWLNCQPSDIMEVIPNTWENADRLCEILDCTKEELSKRVPMEEAE
ncbi:MAG: helix-turn-helix transcriptional regulator [Alphaproteobacteria bacterium]|nr:helix-turn-helix transcriptional regulator [Alphaproteobacteria bacterium]MBQ6886290.1 helix-turn-helix transcriptional regulator [Lachnospiraceae bacterium]